MSSTETYIQQHPGSTAKEIAAGTGKRLDTVRHLLWRMLGREDVYVSGTHHTFAKGIKTEYQYSVYEKGGVRDTNIPAPTKAPESQYIAHERKINSLFI